MVITSSYTIHDPYTVMEEVSMDLMTAVENIIMAGPP